VIWRRRGGLKGKGLIKKMTKIFYGFRGKGEGVDRALLGGSAPCRRKEHYWEMQKNFVLAGNAAAIKSPQKKKRTASLTKTLETTRDGHSRAHVENPKEAEGEGAPSQIFRAEGTSKRVFGPYKGKNRFGEEPSLSPKSQ